MTRFIGKRIGVAVTGGIAAYKACDVIRQLQQEGAEVVALMTPSAQGFITALTLETLTQHRVYIDNLENTPEGVPTHIALAQALDSLVIVPASANTLAKLAHGLADNLVTTTFITFTDKPVVIAPAMNTRMWLHPLVVQNLKTLSALDNTTIVNPDSGLLACGETGDGKLATSTVIVDAIAQAVHPQRLLYQGKRVVVTAGGTEEPIDAVRHIGNRSSGKMGFALAKALYMMGAEVMLIHTMPLTQPVPFATQSVQTVTDMLTAVQAQLDTMDILLMAAAVSDYTPAKVSPGKIKKQPAFTLDLNKATDILETLAPLKGPNQVFVGFAAESEDLLQNAAEKMKRKNLDMIVANDISRSDIGFESADNEVMLLFPKRDPLHLPKASKDAIAEQLLLTLATERGFTPEKRLDYKREDGYVTAHVFSPHVGMV